MTYAKPLIALSLIILFGAGCSAADQVSRPEERAGEGEEQSLNTEKAEAVSIELGGRTFVIPEEYAAEYDDDLDQYDLTREGTKGTLTFKVTDGHEPFWSFPAYQAELDKKAADAGAPMFLRRVLFLKNADVLEEAGYEFMYIEGGAERVIDSDNEEAEGGHQKLLASIEHIDEIRAFQYRQILHRPMDTQRFTLAYTVSEMEESMTGRDVAKEIQDAIDAMHMILDQ